FLNPERVSPPDFDIDFCEKRRGEVIDYVRRKYGENSVAQICTYGCLKAKAAVKDVARVLGYDFEHGDRISKLIPEEPKMTLDKAAAQSPDLAKLLETEPWAKTVFDNAKVIEGLNRQLGIHAAGVIIGDQRLDNLVPLGRGAQGEMITEYTSVPCESLGLLKMDFLGLRTLTIIRNAVDMIEENTGKPFDISTIPIDDPQTYDLLRRGDTVAVFQLESPGMQNLCKTFGVDTMEHIIALLAIYRPGPMQFIPQFIECKHGRKPIEYDDPRMEPILRETYGIMLYQEQIMQVVQALGGFTLGGADLVRRAIGKKKLDVMAKQKSKFVEGCAKLHNINEKTADAIWAKIELFAGYGFNKSHSAAYALVSYRTAYLKAHYPVEFMAAMLTGELANATEIAFLINACRDMKIKVLPPDVNSSNINFASPNGCIRFGLGAIKGVGEVAARAIIDDRRKNGPFASFLDFCERCGSAVNSRMMEKLTRSGAFDALGLRRSQILAITEPMMKFAAEKARDKALGQASLFDLLGGGEGNSDNDSIPIPDIPEFDLEEILHDEKELLGFYVTGHPFAAFAPLADDMASHHLRELAALPDGAIVRLGGMVNTFATRYGKNSGKIFGILMLEDMDCAMECALYDRAMAQLEKQQLTLTPEMPVMLELSVNRREENENPRLTVEKILPMDAAMNEYGQEVICYLYWDRMSPEKMKLVHTIVERHPGEKRLVVCPILEDNTVVFVETKFKVAASLALWRELGELLGMENLRLQSTPHHFEIRQRRKFTKPEESKQA
ncbi:MAG: DNA polymerase III subunit alpha, partial [Victivallaceae bacterium]|nr:DNA polymerase III subunit alpha [Victivallaceae bacterium]